MMQKIVYLKVSNRTAEVVDMKRVEMQVDWVNNEPNEPTGE